SRAAGDEGRGGATADSIRGGAKGFRRRADLEAGMAKLFASETPRRQELAPRRGIGAENVIEREPTPLRAPRPPEHGRPLHADHVPADPDPMLEPDALREGFALARRESARPRRWLADRVGNGPHRQAGRNEEVRLRLDELEAVEQKLALRERELTRREEAAARWFRELNRTHRLNEEKQQRPEGR